MQQRMAPPGKLSKIIRAKDANSSGKRDFLPIAIGCAMNIIDIKNEDRKEVRNEE
ncbi:hypothetical protein Bresa_03449|uniref:Uncharacterized protein n=1 Tax=Brenneria salicis ATCC 15712 = DSM 30166 TaxID=714314 RepID=A0A366I7F5_9GAMM|nr:hypothetical protein [Brenneria salicis ATCC 15712 = DSM 30166]RBP65138.1 hypothetical protein DES54_10514 [Brenneria salicis ATCC 15712 = DSM 30166]